MIRRLILAVFALASVAAAQNVLKPEWASTTASGSIGAAGTDCSTPVCVWIVSPPAASSIAVQLSGTFAATLKVEQSVNGSTWVTVGTATTAGISTFSTSAGQYLRVRCSAYTSGTVSVSIGTAIGGGGSGVAAVGCAAAPGDTTGTYRQQCQTTDGALYVCNNSSGCSVTADWIVVSGSTGAAGPAYGNVQQYGAGGNTTLALTLAAAGAGGTALIPAGSAITLTTAANITQAGLKLRCEAGATITKGANMSQMLNVTGANVTVDGCILDGAQAGGFTGFVISTGSAANGFRLYRSTIKNAASTAISMGSTTDVEIAGNSFSGNIGTAVYAFDNSSGLRVHDNYIDASDVTSFHKGVAFHSNSGSNRITDAVVANNTIIGGNSFCVEIGAFSGLAPQRISVSGNVCRQATSATGFGGYSFDTVDGLSVTGNLYDNETTRDSSLAGLELVGGTGATATGNTIRGAGISINQQTLSNVTGNRVKRGFTGTGIYVGSSTTTSVDDNIVSSNIIDMSGITDTAGAITAIWHQCNHAGIDCSNDQIIGNKLINDYNTSVTSTGLVFQNTGTVRNTFVAFNQFVGWPLCYGLGTSNVNTVLLNNDEAGCTSMGSYASSPTLTYIGRRGTNNLNLDQTLRGSLAFSALSTPAAPTVTAVASGGTLGDSTSYCYVTTAVNNAGTTVASPETCATTGSSGNTNSVTITPAAVLGATSYNVYGRATGAELKLTASALATGVVSFTDTGSVTPSGALPAANTTLGSLSGLGYIDFPAGSAPANPAANTFRVYGDSGATALICLTSTGASCVYAPGTDILSGDIPPIDLGHTGTNGGITGTLSITQLNSTGATTGQVPQYNGSSIAWATLAATGNMVETVVLSDPTGGATCTTAGIDVQFSTASNTWWACGGDAKWYKLLASQNSGSALLAMQNSSGLPTAPSSGIANLYTTTTSVMQTQNSSNAVASTGVVPTDCTSTGLVQKINTDGTVGCAAAGAVSFGTVSGGSNTTAAMTVGTGASLGPVGTGAVKATSVVDSAQLPVLDATAVGSAVDYLTATNAATANPATVKLGAKGSDSNVNLQVNSKGTGVVEFNGTAAKVDASGNATVQDLTINGTCTGCGAGGATGNQNIRPIGMTFDGGGSALTATTRCRLVNASGTISGVSIVADQSGSATVDIKTVAYASYTGPASASSITAAAIPALSSAVKYQDTTLTGWTTSLSANTVVCFVLTAPSTVTWLDVNFKYTAN